MSRVGLLTAPNATFFDLLDRLRDEDFLPREVAQLFGERLPLRRARVSAPGRLNLSCKTH